MIRAFPTNCVRRKKFRAWDPKFFSPCGMTPTNCGIAPINCGIIPINCANTPINKVPNRNAAVLYHKLSCDTTTTDWKCPYNLTNWDSATRDTGKNYRNPNYIPG